MDFCFPAFLLFCFSFSLSAFPCFSALIVICFFASSLLSFSTVLPLCFSAWKYNQSTSINAGQLRALRICRRRSRQVFLGLLHALSSCKKAVVGIQDEHVDTHIYLITYTYIYICIHNYTQLYITIHTYTQLYTTIFTTIYVYITI